MDDVKTKPAARLRRPPRLRQFDYRGGFAYNLTLVTRRRAHVLHEAEVVETVLKCLALACQRYHFTVYAYCLMPDHLHLLVSGEDDSSLKDFVRYLKQLSSHRFKASHGSPLWQISYYDHVIRRDEDLNTLARYIWGNPVRAGLVVNWNDYPYSGPRPLTGDVRATG